MIVSFFLFECGVSQIGLVSGSLQVLFLFSRFDRVVHVSSVLTTGTGVVSAASNGFLRRLQVGVRLSVKDSRSGIVGLLYRGYVRVVSRGYA